MIFPLSLCLIGARLKNEVWQKEKVYGLSYLDWKWRGNKGVGIKLSPKVLWKCCKDFLVEKLCSVLMFSSGLDASQDRLKERVSGMKWRQRHRCVIFAMGLGSTFSQVLSLDPVIPLKDTIPSSASLKQK